MKRNILNAIAVIAGLSMAAPAAWAAKPDRRAVRQQKRIAQGVESAALTPGETARLERKEGKVSREVARDRAANGGHLTPAERRRVNRQQNRLSRQIRREKHDADVR